jgi:hypothetical protein
MAESGVKEAEAAAPKPVVTAENIQAKVNAQLDTCAPVEINGKTYGIQVNFKEKEKAAVAAVAAGGGKRNKRKTRSKRSARKSHKSRRVFGGKRK